MSTRCRPQAKRPYQPGLLPDDLDREGIQGHHYIREELSGFFRSCLTTTNRQDRRMAAGIPGNFVGFNFGFFFFL